MMEKRVGPRQGVDTKANGFEMRPQIGRITAFSEAERAI